jgi:PAS domain S-box-containing protein
MRLKTKLVLAISGMVVAVVAAFSTIYISQLVRQRVNQTFNDGDFVAHQMLHGTRQALELDFSSTRLDATNRAAVQAAVEETLQTDPGLNSLLQSIVGYSPTIYDVAIADVNGRPLLHSDPQLLTNSSSLPQREDFRNVRDGGFRRQLAIVYGEPRVYEIALRLERDGAPFGSIRVGISTVFLKGELAPLLNRAIAFSGIAILISLVLAAGLSNIALRPLEVIGRRLDLMTGGPFDSPAEGREREGTSTDEVGVVTTKINRLGRQMRDVKEVFSALKENLDQIMANLQDGLVLFTRDARAILVSAAVEHFVGVPRGDMLGHNVGEFFSGQTRLGRTVLDAFELHQPLEQREVEMEDGRRIQVSLDFIEEAGEQIGALMTLRDAESVRRIEDEIELSHRLAAIGRLASGVGHEVKNPINAIVVHLEVLRQKLQHIDPDTRRHMDVIGSEIQRLDRVVQMLVDFTRPVELRLAETDLRRLVNEVVLLASPDAERHGVNIVRQFPEDPLPVKVDADLMKQAVLNVVLNGVQAMPQGGTLTVATSQDENGLAQIDVRDEGSGIAEDVRDKIYNLYFSTKKGGTGIGLAMTYKVMQLHNGLISFDSSNRGTVFYLKLPMLEPSEEAAFRPVSVMERQ